MKLRTRTPVVALLGLGYLLAIVLAPISLSEFCVCALLVLGGEALVLHVRNLWMPTVVQRTLGTSTRLLVIELLAVFALVKQFPTAYLLIVGLGLTSIVVRALKVRVTEMVHARSEPNIAWRNLNVRRPVIPLVRNLFTSGHTREKLLELLVLLVASLPTALLNEPWPAQAALAVIVLLRLGTLVYVGLNLVRVNDADTSSGTTQAVKAALNRYDPSVVLFIGGGFETVHAANVWTSTLEGVRQRALIVVRDRWHVSQIRSLRIPVVYLPAERDVEQFLPGSVRVALYPLNFNRNSDVINRPSVIDVFIGHGDSDKASSANPVSKVYDEIWVAGPAAVERYLRAGSGVDPARIRQIGRPQLADVRRAGHGEAARNKLFTVLYAPTWEGPSPELTYSSLPWASAMVERLIAVPGVQVIYKRHPSTGSRDRQFRQYERDLIRTIKRAGKPHRVVRDLNGLYQSFNDASAMISDVSSVITDFLYTRKPYIVTNPDAIDTAAFHEEFPSSAGAHLLAPDLVGLEWMIEDARGADTLRATRRRTANWLLGDSERNPLKRFEGALDDLLLHSRLLEGGSTSRR